MLPQSLLILDTEGFFKESTVYQYTLLLVVETSQNLDFKFGIDEFEMANTGTLLLFSNIG